MRVWIQSHKGYRPASKNFFEAMCGFEELGAEICFFHNPMEMRQAEPEDILVGYVEAVQRHLDEMGFSYPDLDYPAELEYCLGRKIWKSTINTINSHPEQWPVFVKSIADKEITGVLIRSPKDLVGCGNWEHDVPVWCSEPVQFITEWRCFIRYGKILDARHYRGTWEKMPDPEVIKKAVQDYKNAPAGYSLDFGLTDTGKTLLIEVNDGYALGSYGLFYVDYAKLLAARWAELTGTKDEYEDF